MAAAETSHFETTEVTVKQSKELGYGFSIMGGDNPGESGDTDGPTEGRECSPVFISKIKPGAPADGKVKVGSQIIEINGRNIVGLSHRKVIDELKRARGQIKLMTRAPKASSVYLAQVSYEKVRVLFPFHAQNDDELEVVRGDVIYVMGKGSDGWAYGVCQRTGLSGMFPGNFAVLMKPSAEVLDSVYSELEARDPGFTHRGHAEVLYEELPLPLGSRGGSLREGERSNPYESVPDGGAARLSLPDDSTMQLLFEQEGAASSGSAGARGRPEVRLVGRELRGTDGADDPVYAPIEPAALDAAESGEIIYANTPAQDADGGPVIESLYSSVERRASDGAPAAAAGADGGGVPAARLPRSTKEDIYATLTAVTEEKPPEMPVRQYDKSLLPPTIRVHVAGAEPGDADSTAYELLPWQTEGQQELDVDTVATARRVSQTMFASLPDRTASAPGPALPPRKPSIISILPPPNVLDPSDPSADHGAKPPLNKSEIKALMKQQKADRKQLLKQQRNELKQAKKEALARKKEAKKERAAEKKGQKVTAKAKSRKSLVSGDPVSEQSSPMPLTMDGNIYDVTEPATPPP
mmetsp:Transcript_19387/g.50390  ORF Transcript_19387/g.50390 Transcript_19387/m.50390 type:complete len:581 (+) Transcript_19387:288-2030(+)